MEVAVAMIWFAFCCVYMVLFSAVVASKENFTGYDVNLTAITNRNLSHDESLDNSAFALPQTTDVDSFTSNSSYKATEVPNRQLFNIEVLQPVSGHLLTPTIDVGNVCSCDELEDLCDINCCCDKECSQELALFTGCTMLTLSGNNQFCSHATASYALQYTVEGYSQLQSFVQQEMYHDSFCIQSHNPFLVDRQSRCSRRVDLKEDCSSRPSISIDTYTNINLYAVSYTSHVFAIMSVFSINSSGCTVHLGLIYNFSRKEWRCHSRRCYGENLKRHLSANPDPSTVWKGLQSITGYKKQTPRPVESPRLANQLNRFYCRFDRSSHTMGLPAAQSKYSPLPTTALSTPLSSLSPSLSLAEATPALQIREEEVPQMFRRQKTRKAPGPDGVSPSCLKVCAEQLAPTFARIFNRSLELCEVPSCFKSSTIVPVAKKPAITGLNDYRPVALTSVVTKSFERLVLKDVTGPLLDPLQCAYRANRSVDDAVNRGLHYILHHLDTPGMYTRILFVDFSLAFNTIAPDILQQKLIQLAVPASTCQWITSFLTNRRQRVRLGGITSDTRTTNIGAPQGCVLSPMLFSLYTNDFSSGDSPVKLLKYADEPLSSD
ncbi:probable RNA-directed DNA polymerase from transposon X-element isoform X11 [Syngnathus typhle]|uniref:probable RNA-directed DNA polymerase from transposon X-element isoform X11 n=1 Tax=Syngnathus typhle TaxID=161592 RepID=UPI002A69B3E5|nr:probable RNA-directed DNA polymerase from transposon X-element isoform X11 [Syngnathus typhle]